MKLPCIGIALMLYCISCTQTSTKVRPPSTAFQGFVAEIATFKWLEGDIESSLELHTYPALKKEKRTSFDPYFFYSIEFEDSKIGKSYNQLNENSAGKMVFEKVKYIWSYFYENEKKQDGVIEEWTFDTEQEAEAALQQLSNPRFIIHFADNLYYCRLGNQLFIFQTESSFYTNEQRTIFELFVEQTDAQVGL